MWFFLQVVERYVKDRLLRTVEFCWKNSVGSLLNRHAAPGQLVAVKACVQNPVFRDSLAGKTTNCVQSEVVILRRAIRTILLLAAFQGVLRGKLDKQAAR